MKHLLINIPRKIYIIDHNEQTLGNTDRAILLSSEHLSESCPYNQENEAEWRNLWCVQFVYYQEKNTPGGTSGGMNMNTFYSLLCTFLCFP